MLDFRHSPCEYLKVNTSVQQVQGHNICVWYCNSDSSCDCNLKKNIL
jgi:hypothetical protein